jgi:hypothetical protein
VALDNCHTNIEQKLIENYNMFFLLELGACPNTDSVGVAMNYVVLDTAAKRARVAKR